MKKKEVMQYPETLMRMNALLKKIRQLAREIGISNAHMIAHLLFLSTDRIKNLKKFSGVDITRAGRGKKIK